MKNIFITGGAGYVGCRMVPILLEKGFNVTIYDIMYFTKNFLPDNHSNLKIINGDIRNLDHLRTSSINHDVFIHLACISNDSSFALNENLSKSINFDCFESLVKIAKENNIKKFIYASTSSVYGISDKKNVTEEHPLMPITLYNKFKGDCEPILLKNISENFEGIIFRPATVCGYSPRMRFDLSVNILTNFAYNKGFIKIFGGKQLRPNLHILDYIDAVILFINSKNNSLNGKIYNVGYENFSIEQLANKVKKTIEQKKRYQKVDLIYEKSDDIRSYHIDSSKIKKDLGFEPKRNIEDAIDEICRAFDKGILSGDTFDNDIYYNVKRLLKIQAL